MYASPYRRRPMIDWQVALLSTVLTIVVMAVLAIPVAVPVTGLLELAHQIDSRVPALAYGTVWALVYAAGLVRSFMHFEVTFTPR